jgi:alpha-tubulin suppressor-like RCC1 family protein
MKRSAPLLCILAVLGAACSSDPSGTGTAATRLVFQVAPAPSARAGVAIDPVPVVQLADNAGNPVALRGVLVTASLVEGPGSVGGTASVRTADDGTAAFPGLTIIAGVGVKTLRFSATGLGAARSDPINHQAGPPASAVSLEGNNQSATAGTALLVAPAVKVLDAGGNPVPGVEVRFEIVTGGGTISGGFATTGADGIARVESWTLGPAGVQSIRAVVAGLESQPVTFSATAVMPVPVAFPVGNNQTGFAGDILTKDIQFRLVNVSGVPRAGVTVTFAVTSGGGSVSPTTVVTDASGSGTTRWTLGPDAGTQTAVATAPDQGDGILTATAVRFVSISAAGSSVCGLTSEGGAYCWGSNTLAQLGSGNTISNRPRAGLVVGGHVFEKLESAGLGNFHCGIKAGGTGFCWGSARHGQLGDGALPLGGNSSSSSPLAVVGGVTFDVIEPGGDHVCGLDIDGLTYCWGSNSFGQSGPAAAADQPTPVRAADGFTFARIATGSDHTCGLTPAGDVYCWGNRNGYQAGTTQTRTIPILIPGGTKFTSIVAGRVHTCGLTIDGRAHCWGQNGSGQLGDGTVTTRATPVSVSGGLTFVMLSAQGLTTCGLTADGAAYCWGENGLGEAGVGHQSDLRVPTQVEGGLQFTSLTVGLFSSCGLVDAGVAWCWGPNESGQVGDGTFEIRSAPTRVGF